MHIYKTEGVCAKRIFFEIKEGKLYDVKYSAGCNGNTKALSKLLEGKEVKEVIDTLKGVECGSRGTSCANELVKALEEIINEDIQNDNEDNGRGEN